MKKKRIIIISVAAFAVIVFWELFKARKGDDFDSLTLEGSNAILRVEAKHEVS